jgi:hypothetical protein
MLDAFNFADRNGVLFEWNDNTNKCLVGLVEEDVVSYPSLMAEIPSITLNQDQPILSIEEKNEPQGCAEANLEPFGIAGVDTPTIIHANNNEIEDIDDNNDSLLSIATTPQNNSQNPLILPDTSEGNHNKDSNNDADNKDDDSSNDNSLQGGNQGGQEEV